SHFLEHMAFKGTERRDAAAIAREIENVGGPLNAYTAREQTAYYCKVLKEDLPLAADIIGDILTHSTFIPEELERERGVILQEIGQANDTPDDIIFDHFQQPAYPNQPMGPPARWGPSRCSTWCSAPSPTCRRPRRRRRRPRATPAASSARSATSTRCT